MNIRKAMGLAAVMASAWVAVMPRALAGEGRGAPTGPSAEALAECLARLGAACPLAAATPSLQGITGSARLWLQGITGSAGPTLQGITGSARTTR